MRGCTSFGAPPGGDPVTTFRAVTCTKCWWHPDAGRPTHCGRCGAPLVLPDGKRVLDAMSSADATDRAIVTAAYRKEPPPTQTVTVSRVMLGATAVAAAIFLLVVVPHEAAQSPPPRPTPTPTLIAPPAPPLPGDFTG